LDLQIFISSDAFNNSAFFHEQLEFTWLISVCGVAVKAGREIDAPGSDPILLYHALVRYFCWLIPLLLPFGSGVQVFQAFGSGTQLFQTFGLGSQLFQPFGSAISFSSFCHGSEMDWMYRNEPYQS
jgi:hypothetical protein